MLRPLRRAVKQTAKRFGYEIVPSSWMASALLAQHLRELFTRLEIDCVLDVGANRGQYHQFLREFTDYRGRIISFEPITDNVRLLETLAESDPLWTVHGYALGHEATHLELNVMAVDTFSSFLTPDHSGIPQFNHENIVHHRQRAEVKRLADVLPDVRRQFGVRNVYLKMDTQGFDLSVVAGTGDELQHVRALQTELALGKLYVNMPGYDEVLHTLTAAGFDVSGMFVVSSDASLRAIECDCVMVSRTLPRSPASSVGV